ncbi:MAG TPA: polysaccharide ABC transporter ATP-binding protein [Candidatus Acidoferrales bacterium]|nr:polysaccharide ABC transporter ATP-binding protein [Candidatus Acidoferrales bacterium]
MTDAVIRAESIGKRYRVGERERYVALRDVLANAIKFRGRAKKQSRDFVWAVREVSFDVKRGEVVGLIGRNGAGKTTLLKLLARITRPTSGWAEIHGRIGSLLEVGTGFHPELTGRENIFLSGAILGMSRAEIRRKYDEIVAFAEVERFIDTPLKHFSSGMQMRLAFAVAAHLEPEILLVDEVLAVGDLAFQKKCLGKMQEVSQSGRTIIFVSHQMNQIRRLCERVIWLDAGEIRQSGAAQAVVGSYEATTMGGTDPFVQSGAGGCFRRWEISGEGGEANVLRDGLKPLILKFTVRTDEPILRGHFGVHVRNHDNVLVASWGFDDVFVELGTQQLLVYLPFLPLRPGLYRIFCSLYNDGNNLNGGRLLEVWDAVPCLAIESPPLSHSQDAWAGLFNISAELKVDSFAESRV